MRNVIHVRKGHPTFGLGGLRVLTTDHDSVLAFVREYAGDGHAASATRPRPCCACSASRTIRSRSRSTSTGYAGATLYDLFGGGQFPSIGEDGALTLTLGTQTLLLAARRRIRALTTRLTGAVARGSYPGVMEHWGRLGVFDLETTGVDVDTARIVSACIAVLDPTGGLLARWDWLADPGVEIPAGATAVHGIDTERARAEGRPAGLVVAEIASTLRVLFGTGIPVVVYNAPYDLSLLDRECRRHGVEPLEPASPVVDPLVIDKALDRYRKGKRTLEVTAQRYGVSLEGAHDAGADAIAAGRVAQALALAFPQELDIAPAELHALPGAVVCPAGGELPGLHPAGAGRRVIRRGHRMAGAAGGCAERVPGHPADPPARAASERHRADHRHLRTDAAGARRPGARHAAERVRERPRACGGQAPDGAARRRGYRHRSGGPHARGPQARRVGVRAGGRQDRAG